MTTKLFPLSAFKMILVVSFFRFLKALLSSVLLSHSTRIEQLSEGPSNTIKSIILSIVTSIDSALYNTSGFLSQILSPLQNQNGSSVANSTQFRNDISSTTIPEDETMMSFDIVS